MISLYNTLSRKKEPFKPLTAGHVGVYTCGPTVYWFAHVGNLRTYVFADVLRRVFEFNGFKVKHIINVTDVGHLTNDSDDGDDKMEVAAKKEGKSASDIAKFYFDEFNADLDKLNILQPSKWSWASKHIKEQIDLIKKLEKGGFIYETSDGIYFDTAKFDGYGKLSLKKLGDLQGGKRVRLGEKRSKTDFALWKFSSGEKRLQEWPSPWGVGFPGWHIECSAMASKYLGKHFDIHTGGIDHIPIHHENEIAQSTCGFGSAPANYWMHGEFLISDGKKASKSSGKIKRLSELVADGVDPLAFRYFCFTAHYRKPLTWSEESLDSALTSFKRLRTITTSLVDDKKVNKEYLELFTKRINDDLDMPGAVAVLWKLVRDSKAVGKCRTIKKMDEVFALDLCTSPKVQIPANITKLMRERERARKNKDFVSADVLRDKITRAGWVVKDTVSGPVLQRHV